MKDLLIIFLSAMAAALILGSCVRQDMRSAQVTPQDQMVASLNR